MLKSSGIIQAAAHGVLIAGVLAGEPEWWRLSDSPIVSPSAVNNYGPANVGQAKHVAYSALEMLQNILPDVADDIEDELVGIGNPIPSWDPPSTQAEADLNYGPLAIGQLKAVADPFYSQFNGVAPNWLKSERVANGTDHAGTIFPWTLGTGDDENMAIANLGQLKAVFALRLTEDSENDGLPDLWEHAVVDASGTDAWTSIAQINPSNVAQASTDSGFVLPGLLQGDADGDGVSDMDEVLWGVSNYLFSDSDGDGLSDAVELAMGLNPKLADTDGDGVLDSVDERGLVANAAIPADATPSQGPVITILTPGVVELP